MTILTTFLFYIVCYVPEVIILILYCDKLFIPKVTRSKQIFVISLCYTALLCLYFLEMRWLNLIALLVFNFIAIFIPFKVKWHSALFHSFIIVGILCFSELLIMGINAQVLVLLYTEHVYTPNLIFSAAYSKFVYFLIIQIILFTMKGRKEISTTFEKAGIGLHIIPILSVFIDLTLCEVCLYFELPSVMEVSISISSVLLLVINLLIYWLYNYNQKKNKEHTELQLQLQKESDMADYYKQLIQQDEAQKILTHDIKNHLHSIASLVKQGENDKLLSYIENLLQSKDLQSSVRLCDNDMLNAILCRYQRDCANNKTIFHTDIRSGLLNDFSYEEITSLFTNLMDNAMEATSLIADATIDLSIIYQEKAFATVITLVNSCQSNPFDSTTGKLLTHKKDAMRHGYGIRSIERVVKAHHGEMTMYYKEKEFHTVIMIK